MERASGHNNPTGQRSSPPVSPQSESERIGAAGHRARVRSRSPEAEREVTPSFQAHSGEQYPSILRSPNSPGLRARQTGVLPMHHASLPSFQAPDGGRARKVARSTSSIVLPPLTGPQLQPQPAAAGLNMPVQGVSPARLAEIRGALEVASAIWITSQELASLTSLSLPPLAARGSTSDGRFLVAYATPPAQQLVPEQADRVGPGPIVERELDSKARSPVPVPVPAPVPVPVDAHEDEADAQVVPARPQHAFEPVSSVQAKILRADLLRRLNRGDSEKDIYHDVIRKHMGHGLREPGDRLAFTHEFLTALLLVLPKLAQDAHASLLGRALGRKRPRGGGSYLSLPARSAIGRALAHPAVQERVPLDRIVLLLRAANQTGGVGRFNKPRDEFTRSGAAHGIPQALARRLVKDAERAAGDVAPVLATAQRLGAAMTPGRRRVDNTYQVVMDEIDKAVVSAGVKKQIKAHFTLGYFAKDSDELSAGDLSADEAPAGE